MKKKFKVGDRVRIVTTNIKTTRHTGEMGTILSVDGHDPKYRYQVHPDSFNCEGGIYCKVKEAKMSKYDADTVTAIEKSIEHHEENLDKLKYGGGVFENLSAANTFRLGGIEISYAGGVCALCGEFGNLNECNNCPLDLEGYNCKLDDSPWNSILNSETQQQAITAEENMVKALKSLLEVEKILKEDTTGLKERIERLTGWDKEADDILEEILPKLPFCCNPAIEVRMNQSSKKIGNIVASIKDRADREFFHFTDQYQKLQAFKDALIWLAEKAGVLKKYTCEDCGREIKHRGRCLNCNSKREKIIHIDDEIEALEEKKKELEV